MNVHDSRRIEEVLDEHGYGATQDASEADVIVFNTCSVREKAEQKLRSAVGTYKDLKLARPDLVMVVAGCVAQQEGDKLLRRVRHLDVVIGPDNIVELPALIDHVQNGGPPLARTVFDNEAPRFLTAKPRTHAREVTSFVTVMKGCDERCTYCIVPYTRGSERYRPADEIVGEVARLVAGGVREVTLLGQTVNSWHSLGTGEGESEFPVLLRRIAREVPELLRLRYTSPHPRHLTPALIDAHAELSVLPRHLHLPVQSGSDRMLKRMLRRYTAQDYLARVAALKARVPGLTLSTDVIVGFPGETDDDFEQTLALVRAANFVSLFGFKYSQRPYTPALKLDDDVTEELKDERLARLFEVVANQQTAHLASLVGTTQRVLLEEHDAARLRFTGRSEQNELVHVDAEQGTDLRGAIVEATIVEAFKHSLHGVMRGVPVRYDRPRTAPLRLPLAAP
jgi:tRNA-2-methylthio-N6-dimethylallyladenosine synthase